jgi:uncharacterized membrane protein YdbT with pleckstrin-like domain
MPDATNKQRMHPRYVWYHFVVHGGPVLFFSLIISLFIALGGASGPDTPGLWLLGGAGFWLAAGVTFSIPILLWYGWCRLVYRFYRYELRASEFRFEYGVLNKHHSSLPYSRIQNIDIGRSLIQRIFGISELQIQTAGESSMRSEGRLPGLDPDTAEWLRDTLLSHAGITS